MKIQVNTDNNIQGRESLAERVEHTVRQKLGHFSEHITRIEVHLRDENAHKGGQDKNCTMEARIEGLKPVAVSDRADILSTAIDGATEKMKAALQTTIGRRNNKR